MRRLLNLGLPYKINSDNNRRRGQRLSSVEEDRLSSLPDDILTEILSRLSICEAASTSVLSTRWRRLWTGVTSLYFYPKWRSSLTFIDHILRQLISVELRVFHLHLGSTYDIPEADEVTGESCFTEVMGRNVKDIDIYVPRECDQEELEDKLLNVPACFFNSQSLVRLKLHGMLGFELPENGDVNLPNLKHLYLRSLRDLPPWLNNLFKSSPLLEDLDLRFLLDPELILKPNFVLKITSPNLTSLNIKMYNQLNSRRTKICIEAPRLVNLEIIDSSSIYQFLQKTNTLVNASINLEIDGYQQYIEEDGYVVQMSKFVGGMSSVRTLELKLGLCSNIIKHFNCWDNGIRSIFHNLGSLTIHLEYICMNIWTDLLLCMQWFPNLEVLEVQMILRHGNWCVPDFVPECLVSKLKTVIIGITAFDVFENDIILKLLAYILRNANFLEELCVYFYIEDERSEAQLFKQCNFCNSLFKLKRKSSNCEVVFYGSSVRASSNAFKNGCLTCEMYLG